MDNPKQLYDYALDEALAVGVQVDEDDLHKPTPDTQWDVKTLMRHMLCELVWIPDMLGGKTVSEVGDAHEGDLLGSDMVKSWREAIETARKAMQRADLQATAQLSYADKPIHEYLLESADDILVHSWDLGRAINVSVIFDDAVAHTLYDYMSRLLADTGGGSMFGAPVTVPASASWQTKLLALLGRSESWS